MSEPTTTAPATETPAAAASAAAEAGEQQKAPKAKKAKPPRTAEQRERATARQDINRQLEAIISSGDGQKVLQAAEALRAVRHGEPPQKVPQASTPGESTPHKAAPAPRPGWPTDEQTAQAMGLAQTAVQTLNMAVGLVLEVDLNRPRHLPGLEQPVVLSDMLVKDAAPVVALYAPDFLTTPWGALACTMLSVASIVLSEVVVRDYKAAAIKELAKSKVEGAGTPASGGATA